MSINYRLAAFGYLALPQLDAETPAGSGNWGLMDQLQSLKWVRKTIASYGGDPHLVTIAGQSAGAAAVCAMPATPSAKGYFQRAIIQSGPCRANATKETAEKTGLNFAHAAGRTDDAVILSCLRLAWPGNLVAAEQKYVVNSRVTNAFLPRTRATRSPTGPGTRSRC